jgi:hypothetical protein
LLDFYYSKIIFSYINRCEWENLAEKIDESKEDDDDFHSRFMKVFLKEKLKQNDKIQDKYYKVRVEDRFSDLEFIDGSKIEK